MAGGAGEAVPLLVGTLNSEYLPLHSRLIESSLAGPKDPAEVACGRMAQADRRSEKKIINQNFIQFFFYCNSFI